ncbi:MAG: helix-turn-helix transcriptional regulator, partial [Verrucomicrobiales bacterium]|nr:helix-turn-helix transcriptional regulator [Verrucomicrobiales bacterium]
MQSSIGHQLAGARRARGLSILDVSHKTRISASNIRSIEADNFANCPSLVYAKGFVKQLDRFL